MARAGLGNSLSLSLGTLALLLAPSSLAAQGISPNEGEVEARGFAAEKLYDFAGVDSVNLFTGGLTVTIPIGPTYHVDGDLSYGLTLVYNSAAFTYHLVVEGPDERLEGVANPLSSAGLGWMVTFGRLVPPTHPVINEDAPQWMYVSPDGGQHFLWSSLHDGEPEVQNVWFSRDGTYVRMQGDPVVGPLELELPDGVIHSFEPFGDLWAGKLAKIATRNVQGGKTTVRAVLKSAQKWLGPGYKEIAPGVFRSANGKRQFRMTLDDLTDARGAHVHFEAVAPDGRQFIENAHIQLVDP